MSFKKKVVIFVVLAAIAAAIIAYLVYGFITYKDSFMPNTTINGVNVSGMTADEAIKKVSDDVEDYTLTISFRDNKEEKISGEKFDYNIDVEDEVNKLLSSQEWLKYGMSYFTRNALTTEGNVEYDSKKLKKAIKALDELDKKNVTAPVDAYVSTEDGKYVVVSEVKGNQLDSDTLYKSACEAVEGKENELDADKAGCYVEPAVVSTDESLNAQVSELNTLLCGTVTYDLPSGEQKVLDGSTTKDWLQVDENGHYYKDDTVWNQKITEFVQSLADEIDTLGKTVEFHATSGETVQLNCTIGWQVDQAAEITQLTENLATEGNTEREPCYSSTGQKGDTVVGNTYIEINLTKQHMWVYNEGQLFMETDVVSGKMTADRYTPYGIFDVAFKDTDRYLKGPQRADGSYEWNAHVDYWMLFYNGCGTHDAYWQSSFGGTQYVSGGSRGCVNMPHDKAQQLYEWVMLLYRRDKLVIKR